MSEKPHIVKSYEEQLQLLKDTIVKMGTGVEKQLENTIQSLVKKDISLACRTRRPTPRPVSPPRSTSPSRPRNQTLPE